MGRYYNGDIEGKFWFAVQNSDDADYFGVEGQRPEMLEYYFDDDEIIIFNSVEEAVDKINKLSEKEYNLILNKGKKRLWNTNTVYHEWNKILPLMDPDYKQIDPIKILKDYHGEYYNKLL